MRTFSIEYQNGITPVNSAAEAKPYIDAMLASAFEYVAVHASEPIDGVSCVQTYLFTLSNNRVVMKTEAGISDFFCPPAEAAEIVTAFLDGKAPNKALFTLCK